MMEEFDSAPSRYYEHVEHMKETICDRLLTIKRKNFFHFPREERKVCCISSSSSLPRLGRGPKVLGCQENPCSNSVDPSTWWPNREGCFKLPSLAISNPSDCYLFLNEDNELECDNEFGLRGGVTGSHGKSKCSKREVWSSRRKKCIKKY